MKLRMKKVMAVILVCSLCVPFVMKQEKAVAAKGYFFKNAGVSVTMGSKAKKFIKKAGKAAKTTKKKSCAFKGLDRIRFYDSFILYTYSNSKTGPEFVNGITFRNASAYTKEGIHIGSTEAEMKEAYGNKNPNLAGVYTYVKGKTKLQIQVVSGKVSLLRYIMK